MKKLVLAMVTGVVSAACGGPHDNCGVGTKLSDGYCVVDYDQIQMVSCGSDTALQGTSCISVLSCGNGASRMGNQCVAAPAGTSCGTGTVLQGTICVSSLSCGSGTTLQNGQCVATGGTGLTCGSGTVQQGLQCVATGAQVTCGSGTSLMSNQCVADLTAVCGSGTVKQGAQCVGTGSASCGSGTTLSNGQCVPVMGTGPLSTFIQAPNLATGALFGAGGYYHRFVMTELTQGNADAWANTGANMIGNGRALHIASYGYWSSSTSTTYLTLADVTGGGSCGSSANPTATPSSGSQAYASFFSWSNGTPTRVACGTQGSVKLEQAINPATMTTQLKATVNGYFSDGTTLTDKVFWFP